MFYKKNSALIFYSLPVTRYNCHNFSLPSLSFQMQPQLLLIFLLQFTVAFGISIECVLPNHPQIRTFSTLLDYQHNAQSFKVNGAGYAGNDVEFSFTSIDRIPRNAFITFTSQYIWSIRLSGKQIKLIDDGAFVNLNCLHILDLGNNSLSTLTEGMWQGLRGLNTLKLNENLIGELKNLVFKELIGLKHLDLSKNRIKKIGIETFEGLHKLETLNLENNFLSNIQSETFASLGSLTSLQLNSNRLQDLEVHSWKNLTKLTELNLADNSLTSFDPAYNFSFISLTTLNLSINALTKLNVHALRMHLPALTTIDLNGNPWLCEDLAVIVPALRDSRIVHIKTKSTTIKNVDGIPCNYNSVIYTERPTTEITTTKKSRELLNSTVNPHFEDYLKNVTQHMRIELEKLNEDILHSMEKTRNLIVSLIVLVVIFIALELTFRAGVINRVIRRREDHYLNDDNVDNIALLTT